MADKLWNGMKSYARLRLSFYGRQNVIQVAKDVVRVLGAPTYISLRVNQNMDSILIEGAEEKNKLSFKVPSDLCLNGNRQMVITSLSFVNGFMIHNKLDLSETYRVDGIYSEKNNAVVFNLRDAKLYVAPSRKAQ